MKKILLSVAIAGFAMASCAKKHTCECTSTITDYHNGAAKVDTQSSSTTTIRARKSTAEKSCSMLSSSTMSGDTQNGYKTESSCVLK